MAGREFAFERAAVLIDGQAYYQALEESLKGARSSIIILGWNVDTRISLNPEAELPAHRESLKQLLNRCLENNPNLHVYVLCWDFALFYSVEAKLLPLHKRFFKHPRARFALDSTHPFGACHHQKLVVIDNHAAYTGGIDLCAKRWDTPTHRTRTSRGAEQAPYHDVQTVVDGEAAAQLGALARERWEDATGEKIPTLPTSASAWPSSVTPHFQNSKVIIARTRPPRAWPYPKNGTQEILQLFEESIRTANRFIYIEQQYFSSPEILRLLIKQLKIAPSLEILIVLPLNHLGFLEKISVGWVRQNLLLKLKRLLRRNPSYQNRIRVVAPLSNGIPLALHSKVMIIDDHFLRIGTANLSQRSMGLDTECDLAFRDHPDTIRRIRNTLIAEHFRFRFDILERLFRLKQNGRILPFLRSSTCVDLLKETENHPIRNFCIRRINPAATAWDPGLPAEIHPWLLENTRAPLGPLPPLGNHTLRNLGFALCQSFFNRRKPRSLWKEGVFAYFLHSQSVHPDSVFYIMAKRNRIARAGLLSSTSYFMCLGWNYLKGMQKPSPISTSRNHLSGAFLPSYMLLSSQAERSPQLAESAGKQRLPVEQLLMGALIAHSVRTFTLAIVLSSQERLSLPGRYTLWGLRILAYRWLLARIRGSSRSLPLELSKFDEVA